MVCGEDGKTTARAIAAVMARPRNCRLVVHELAFYPSKERRQGCQALSLDLGIRYVARQGE